MYCKNCGTKQKEGQKFCPKCGTPYPVVEKPKSEAQYDNSEEKQEQKKEATNQSSTPPPPPPPPLNNGQGNTPPPVGNHTDMAEDFIKQGDKFLKETIDPHLDKGIDKLMETDWKSKAKKVNEAILHFDVKKLKRKHWIYTGIGCVVLFFMLVACNRCGGSFGNVRSNDISELRQIIKKSGTISENEAKCLVVSYILNHMKNPDSYESVYWGRLEEISGRDGGNGGWSIKHKYRGTNSYGGVVTEEDIFLIHNDGYVSSM